MLQVLVQFLRDPLAAESAETRDGVDFEQLILTDLSNKKDKIISEIIADAWSDTMRA